MTTASPCAVLAEKASRCRAHYARIIKSYSRTVSARHYDAPGIESARIASGEGSNKNGDRICSLTDARAQLQRRTNAVAY
jgi:hypothetical protein